MTISDGSVITASDLNNVWTIVTSGINFFQSDSYEENTITFNFDGINQFLVTAESPLVSHIWIPSADHILTGIEVAIADAVDSSTIAFSIVGNINKELTFTCTGTAGAESLTTVDLSSFNIGNYPADTSPEAGVFSFLAGDTVEVSVTSAPTNAISKVRLHLIVQSRWSKT